MQLSMKLVKTTTNDLPRSREQNVLHYDGDGEDNVHWKISLYSLLEPVDSLSGIPSMMLKNSSFTLLITCTVEIQINFPLYDLITMR